MNTPDPCQPTVSKFVMPDGSPIVIEPPAPRRMLEFFAWETLGMTETNFSGLCDELAAMHDIDQYRGFGGAHYQQPTSYRGSCTGVTPIDVLQQLWGLPLCNLILAYVHGLHPTKVVVSTGVVDMLSVLGRVTIFVDDKDIVTKICQEIQVLYGCGADLETMRKALADGNPAAHAKVEKAKHGN